MVETFRFQQLRGGTNVFYANGTQRSDVNTPITRELQRKIVRTLKRQHARKITKAIRSTPNFNTENVAPAFIGLVHPDCEGDIRDMSGFIDVVDYGSVSPYENELGKVEEVRYLYSTVIEAWADAGGTANGMISTSGTNADVYPVLYIAADAYCLTALKGKFAVKPMVVNPKPSDSDPWAQRGWFTWKTMQGAGILNDNWMVRAEVAATA